MKLIGVEAREGGSMEQAALGYKRFLREIRGDTRFVRTAWLLIKGQLLSLVIVAAIDDFSQTAR